MLWLVLDVLHDPRASPVYGDLAGLPPIMLQVGEDEILLDDARRYAERLGAAGSSGELHIREGMLHVFPASLALLGAAREATDSVGDFLRRHLAAPLFRAHPSERRARSN